jgi:hypothetical protein
MGPRRQNRRLEGFRQADQALLAVGLLAVSAAAQTPVVNPGGIVNAADSPSTPMATPSWRNWLRPLRTVLKA